MKLRKVYATHPECPPHTATIVIVHNIHAYTELLQVCQETSA